MIDHMNEPPPPVEFADKRLYRKSEIESMLSGTMDVDSFLARLQPRKRFKVFFLGADLNQALLAVPYLDEKPVSLPPLEVAHRGGRKKHKTDPGERLIGGVFRREDLL